MSWKDKVNEALDKLAAWLGLTPPPVPVPVRKDPRDRRRR